MNWTIPKTTIHSSKNAIFNTLPVEIEGSSTSNTLVIRNMLRGFNIFGIDQLQEIFNQLLAVGAITIPEQNVSRGKHITL